MSRVDKTALFPMRTTVNSVFVDIVWSKEFSFFGHCVQKLCLRTASAVAYVQPP